MAGKDTKNIIPRQAPKRSAAEALIDGAIKAGGGMLSLLSGVLAAALVLYSGYVLFDTFQTERQASSAWDLLQFKPELKTSDVDIDANTLAAINKDYRAWLTVFDTSIDYPVMQGPDDLYYASHDIYGEFLLTGSIYLAKDNSPDFTDSYNLLYGHHMDSGAMFGVLDKYLDEDYFNSHREGILITPEGAYDITIFSVATTDAYEMKIYRVGDYAEEVIDFLRDGGRGGIGVGTQVIHFDSAVADDAEQVIALSTCSDDSGTNGRLVVFGRMTEHIAYADLKVEKHWDNPDDVALPAVVKVTLTADGIPVEGYIDVTLDADHGWEAVAEHMPLNRNHRLIRYEWTEESVYGFARTGYTEGTNGNGYVWTLTNSPTPREKVTLKLVMHWDDAGDRDGLRPESMAVVLSGKGTTDVTLDGTEDQWTAAVSDQPLKDENGNLITYTWNENEEGLRDGYVHDKDRDFWEEDRVEDGVRIRTFHIYNTYSAKTVKLQVDKEWNDDDDRDGLRHSSVSVTLYADGVPSEEYSGIVLKEENGWSFITADLPQMNGGREIVYQWKEDIDPGTYGYKAELSVQEITGDDGRTTRKTTIVNKHEPETVTVTVKKTWVGDMDFKEQTRPDSLELYLMKGDPDDGTLVEKVTLASGVWEKSVTGLPRYEAGEEISYWWEEPEVSGYTLRDPKAAIEPTVKKRAGAPVEYVFTLTNKLETRTLTVRKVWSDGNTKKHDPVTVYLYAGSVQLKSYKLSKENNWTLTVEMPRYENGKEINYSWKEAAVSGYTTKITTNGNVTTITNTKKSSGGGGTPVTYTLTIKYVYEDGTVAAKTYTAAYSKGKTYSVASPVIEGYTASEKVVKGTMPGNNVVVTVTYTRADGPAPEPDTPLGVGDIYFNVGDCLE